MSDTPPTLRRKFQLTNLDGNNNKSWEIIREANGDVISTWGRVGAGQQSKNYGPMSDGWINSKIGEKTDKGYKELVLHVPTTVAAVDAKLPPKVSELIGWIYKENGASIGTFLAQSVDALSQQQIAKGRDLLQQITNNPRNSQVHGLVQAYYNTIPTILPSRMIAADVIANFIKDLAGTEARLDQLEAALSTHTAIVAGASPYAALGATIKLLDKNAPQSGLITNYLRSTGNQRWKIHDIFTVKIPGERKAYEASQVGKSNIVQLWHGTHNPRVLDILKSGLIVPRTPSNGRRFGHGIYFGDMAQRSFNYCRTNNHGIPHMLFLVDVALGNPIKVNGDRPDWKSAPAGYDSTWGIESYSRMDEFIVYKQHQQTIRAIITLE